MKPIFSRTLEVTLKKVSILLVILIGVGCGYLIKDNYQAYTAVAFDRLLERIVAIQNVLVFIGMNGIVLAILTVSVGSGLISSEVHEGTFKLLSAKPNSRAQILASKLLGAYCGLSVLMLLQLLSYFGYMAVCSGFDGNILKEMVAYLPGYILYGFIVIAILLSISTLIGTLAKKKVAALLPLLAIVILIFGGIPFYRIFTNLFGGSGGQISPWIDLNYHFATIFKSCISYRGDISRSDLMAYLTNLCKMVSLDKDIVRQRYSPSALLANNDISSTISLVCYGVVALVMYVSSFIILKKKDI